ncbi:proton-coupled zinc antiporter SLC30A2-like isoform X2 [Apostichopus japonicus]|uniref:proton-coupled zinc antiporter SLC30A2-like isoform X2 n=1 Tax=Stichopus japonicus TaxID=307972 RepID=UPI003AB36487
MMDEKLKLVETKRGQIYSTVAYHCHAYSSEKIDNYYAIISITTLSVVVFIFMGLEFLGGLLSGSLAIMTDAAHLLSDLTGFIISLFALWFARKPATTRMSFGFYRAEIIGAVISVLLIWVLTAVLVYMAIMRCISMDYDIDADIMLITASCGVVINILLILVLQFVGHSHGGGGHSHSFLSSSHGHDDHGDSKSGKKNLNVRAAFIHCIGDLLQSIGVVIAAVIIKVKPEYKLADPICTFLFSVIVMFTTVTILRDAMLVLMEGVPKNVDYTVVRKELETIPGVRMAHSLHVWSLTTTCSAMAVHLAVEPGTETQQVLFNASSLVCQKFGFSFTTIQVEYYIEGTMSSCIRCIGPC